MTNNNKLTSDDNTEIPQLRYDLISGDWVVIAAGRSKRPENYKKEWRKVEIDPAQCPFCNLQMQATPILVLADDAPVNFKHLVNNWTVAVIPNKYPAFVPAKSLAKKNAGEFFQTMNAVGYCELVIGRDHYKHFALMEISQIKEIFDAYQQRYKDLAQKKFVNYISIFHNHGVEAGASQPHPHSQIITSPLVDGDLLHALNDAKDYWKEKHVCLNCEMNVWEEREKKRIVCINDRFIALCPFASKAAFEVVITPRHHQARFEEIDEKDKWELAQIFSDVIKRLYKGLQNPPYNFYIHTSPNDGNYPFYHWHITIIPRIGYMGGFEFGTKMEIVVVAPEDAAQYLREQN